MTAGRLAIPMTVQPCSSSRRATHPLMLAEVPVTIARSPAETRMRADLPPADDGDSAGIGAELPEHLLAVLDQVRQLPVHVGIHGLGPGQDADPRLRQVALYERLVVDEAER